MSRCISCLSQLTRLIELWVVTCLMSTTCFTKQNFSMRKAWLLFAMFMAKNQIHSFDPFNQTINAPQLGESGKETAEFRGFHGSSVPARKFSVTFSRFLTERTGIGRKAPEKIRKFPDGGNTASIFQQFPVFSCRIRWFFRHLPIGFCLRNHRAGMSCASLNTCIVGVSNLWHLS